MSWLPTEGILESGEISISVYDGGEDSSIPANQIFAINVEAINDSPIIVSSPILNAIEDVLYEYQLDPLNAGYAYNDVSNTGWCTYPPSGSHPIPYSVSPIFFFKTENQGSKKR